MRDLTELNINESGRRVNRPAPTDEVINSFQVQFGCRLPEEYIQLLRFANGGCPEVDCIIPTDKSADDMWSVNSFYFLDEDRTSEESLWRETKAWRKVLGANTIPFAEDGGGNQFFLDCNTAIPSVKVCVHDENFLVVDVAPSFRAFIDGLFICDDMI